MPPTMPKQAGKRHCVLRDGQGMLCSQVPGPLTAFRRPRGNDQDIIAAANCRRWTCSTTPRVHVELLDGGDRTCVHTSCCRSGGGGGSKSRRGNQGGGGAVHGGGPRLISVLARLTCCARAPGAPARRSASEGLAGGFLACCAGVNHDSSARSSAADILRAIWLTCMRAPVAPPWALPPSPQ